MSNLIITVLRCTPEGHGPGTLQHVPDLQADGSGSMLPCRVATALAAPCVKEYLSWRCGW